MINEHTRDEAQIQVDVQDRTEWRRSVERNAGAPRVPLSHARYLDLLAKFSGQTLPPRED